MFKAEKINYRKARLNKIHAAGNNKGNYIFDAQTTQSQWRSAKDAWIATRMRWPGSLPLLLRPLELRRAA